MGERWKHWLLPWYNRQAKQIEDPVLRLRYLKSRGANPDQILPQPRLPLERIGAGLLLVIVTGFLYFRSGGSVRAVDNQGQHSGGPKASREYVLEPLTANEKKVWLVEKTAGQEVYSNGLRIETANTAPP